MMISRFRVPRAGLNKLPNLPVATYSCGVVAGKVPIVEFFRAGRRKFFDRLSNVAQVRRRLQQVMANTNHFG